ncbi:hypothetical protein SPLC1_S240620 [Arthrospira platensis C1]|nr:hypothetical protein SPLC1_S240620 [Arthrospira platensis C1]
MQKRLGRIFFFLRAIACSMTARRHELQLKVAIRNPVVWLIEVLQEQ